MTAPDTGASMTGLERIVVNVGGGFDPDSEKNRSQLAKMIEQKHGEGYSIESYNPDEKTVSLTRSTSTTTVTSHAGTEALQVRLPGDAKPHQGELFATSLPDAYPGYVLTSFEPHRRAAILAKLDDDVLLARDTLSNALGVKPWEIQVSKLSKKKDKAEGYQFSLPSRYMPSKHDDKLAEAAEMVGEPGWYVHIDIRGRQGRIIKAHPPTFDPMYPSPVDDVEHFDHTNKKHYQIPLGIKLPGPGEQHSEFSLDLEAAQHLQMGGISGSGKALALSTIIPTPNGPTTMGQLEVGDVIYTRNGGFTQVTAVYDHAEKKVHDIRLADNQVIRACEDHLWVVVTDEGEKTMSTADLIAADAVAKRFYIRASAPVVGGWDATLDGLGEVGAALIRSQAPDDRIPGKMMAASIDQRRELLSGMLGWSIVREAVTSRIAHQRLADSLVELARSLGFYARLRDIGGEFEVTVAPSRNWPLTIKAITEAGTEDVRCITVDAPDSTFLCAGYVPTHNTVTINKYVYTWLSRGADVAIIDTPDKAVDFMWCKPYLMEGGWGCDSIFHSATTSEMIVRTFQQRASQMKREGYENWKAMPAGKGFRPVVLVVDEVSALYSLVEVPKANKDSPPKMQEMKADAEAENFAKSVLKRNIKRIAAEARFAGVFLLISTQIASTNTGLGTDLRTNLQHKMLLGANPTEGNRKLVFPDPDSVPAVPENVKADSAAARGVGTADPDGSPSLVFKSYFATPDEYLKRLAAAGVVKRDNVNPSAAEVIDIFGEETIPEEITL